MATNNLRANPAVRKFSRKYGALEEVTLVFDAEDYSFANADVQQILDVYAGDSIMGGFSRILVTGLLASAVGQVGDGGLVSRFFDDTILLDGAADAYVGITLAAPYTYLVDDSIDFNTNTAEWTSGRFSLTLLIHRGSRARSSYENYVNDPNRNTQV